MLSRRDLLAGGTAVATVALAGCLDSLPLDGSGSDEPAATDWMAASVFDTETLTRVERPAQLAAVEGFDYVSAVGRLPGVDYAEVDLQVTDSDAPLVLLGSFDAESVVEAFGEAIATGDPQLDGSYGGYDVYTGGQPTGSETEPTLGVDDGTAVVASTRDGVEDSIDASRGEATRLVETDSQFEQLQGTLDGAEFYQLLRPESASDVLLGVAATVDSDDTELRLVVDHPDTDGAETFGEDAPNLLSETALTDTGIEVDGERVRLTGTRQTDEIEGVDGLVGLFRPVLQYFGDTVARGPAPPQVSLGYDYDESEETLEITVRSGDTFTAGQVQFRGSGFDETGASWAEVTGTEVTPESTVAAGDRVTLTGVGPAFELDVVWESSNGGESAIIAVRTGPDA